MGKSPGRWIKKVLFGKKTSKSNSGQGKQKPVSGKEVHVRVVAGETGVNDNPLEVSSGGLSAVHVDELNLSSDYRDASYVQQDQDIQKPGDQNADVGQMRELDALTDEEKIVQEKAAKKTQAANETGVVDNPPVVSSGGLSAVHVDKLNLSSDYREASYVQRDQDIPKPGDQSADVRETRELDMLTDEERILQEKAAKKAQAASETGVDDNPPEVSSGGLSAVHVNELNLSSDYREASYVQQDQDVPEHDQNADVGQMRELDTLIDEEGIVQENTAKKTQEASYVQRDQDTPEPGDQNADVGQMREIETLTDDERIVQEKAAKKAQSAFRGYVARRAYKALKGIIMLQARIRGHLVRRQAVATLYCVVGIVKLQALVRGSRARRSDVGIEVQRVCFVKPEDITSFDGDVESASAANLSPLSANAFIRKLLAPSPERMPLRFQYDNTDPNSVQIWLERWSISCPWRSVSPPKKATSSKILKKTGNTQSVEGEIVKSKRSVRKVPSRFDNALAQSVPEVEKPRRNAKKVSSHPADSVEENPQKELEKVKRSLRKVNSTGIESSTSAEVTEGPPHSQAKPTSSVKEVPDPTRVNPVGNVKDEPVFLLKKETATVPTENDQQTVEDPVENVKEEPVFLLKEEAAAVPTENDQQITEDPVQTSQFIDVSNDETKEGPIQTSQSIDVSNDETTEDPILTSQSIDVSIDVSTEAKVEPAEGNEKVENTHVPKGELKPTADSLPSESQKSSRKASLSATQEEDGLQKSSSPAEVIKGPPHSQVEPIFVHEVPDPIEENPIENMKDEPVLLLKEEATTVRTENDQQTTEDPVQTSQSIDVSNDESTEAKVEPSEGNEKVEITHVANGKLKPTTDSLPSESQKSSRRASLSSKHEHEEDGLQNTPKLPSYMQATKSAKAKLRGQGSPKLGLDSAEKTSPMRRHSLPTTANGKVSSASPRTPKILHGSAKGGNKSDKSLLSSREGNVLPGKATKEWRR